MLVYLIQKMCNYLTLLAKANMAKVIITKQCIARLITCFSVYAGHLISSNSKIAAKEINLPLKNNTGKLFFFLFWKQGRNIFLGEIMPVRLNLFSEIRLLAKLAKTKENSQNIVQHFGIIYSPGNNLKIIEELMEVTFY